MGGVSIHDFFTKNPASLREIMVNFLTRHDDVFVVTHPKSDEERWRKLDPLDVSLYVWIIRWLNEVIICNIFNLWDNVGFRDLVAGVRV